MGIVSGFSGSSGSHVHNLVDFDFDLLCFPSKGNVSLVPVLGNMVEIMRIGHCVERIGDLVVSNYYMDRGVLCVKDDGSKM